MNLFFLIASIAAGVLQADPQLPAQAKQGIADASAALGALLKSGVFTSGSSNPALIISALTAVIAALRQSDPNLASKLMAELQVLNDAAAAAIAADAEALKLVDASLLKPITPLQP